MAIIHQQIGAEVVQPISTRGNCEYTCACFIPEIHTKTSFHTWQGQNRTFLRELRYLSFVEWVGLVDSQTIYWKEDRRCICSHVWCEWESSKVCFVFEFQQCHDLLHISVGQRSFHSSYKHLWHGKPWLVDVLHQSHKSQLKCTPEKLFFSLWLNSTQDTCNCQYKWPLCNILFFQHNKERNATSIRLCHCKQWTCPCPSLTRMS